MNHAAPLSPVTVEAYGRIHFGLVDLSGVGKFTNGGAGMMITPPRISVTVIPTGGNSVWSSEWSEDIDFVRRRLGISWPAEVIVDLDRRAGWHVGLGFHTQLLMALATAFTVARGEDAHTDLLALRMSRGGTSGVGVLGFRHGGLVFDRGRLRRRNAEPFGPSSATPPEEPPILLATLPEVPFFPVLALARDWQPVHGKLERELFAKFTPIEPSEAEACATIVFRDLYQAALAGEFEAFCTALERLRTIGFKQREMTYRGGPARDALRAMQLGGLRGCGMSSWGPVFFGFASSQRDAATAMEGLRRSDAFTDVWQGRFAAGARISYGHESLRTASAAANATRT